MTLEAGFLCACILFVISSTLSADSETNSLPVLDPITVTARKEPEDLEEIPLAVSVVQAEKIRNLTMRQLEDVAAYVPNLNISQGTQFSRLFIRGIGSGLNLAFEQSVGTFSDGIYTGRTRQTRIPLLDVERVEVLKGPQGILFGKNTTAGALNIVTAKPQDVFWSRLSTFYAPDHGEAFAEGAVTGPIAEGLSGRIAGRISQLEGYLQNTGLNRREPERDTQSIRGSLRWDTLRNFQVDAKYEYGHFKHQGLTSQIVDAGLFGPLFRAADPQFETVFDTRRSTGPADPFFGPESSETRYHSAGLFIHSSIGSHEIIATTGYNQYVYDDLLDLDFSALRVVGQFSGEQFKQVSQEIRLESPKASIASWRPWNRDALETLFGVYYQFQDLGIDTTANLSTSSFNAFGIPIPGLGVPPAVDLSRVNRSEQQSHTWSAFARVGWLPVEDWRITAGLRLVYEAKTADKNLFISTPGSRVPTNNPLLLTLARLAANTVGHTFQGSRDETQLMPMAGIEWDISDDDLIYFNFSTSAKSGGFDDLAVSGVQADWEFGDELALSYEVGAKTIWLEGALNLNIALFRSDFNNFQVSQFDGRANFVVGNAASVRSQGIELDGRWRLSEGLSLAAAIALLDAQYTSFPNAGCTVFQAISSGNLNTCRQDLSGKTTPYAPHWSGNFYVDYHLPLSRLKVESSWLRQLAVNAQINVNFSDSYFLAEDLDPLLEQNAFATLDARFAVGDLAKHWQLAFIGKNLTNQLISLEGNDVPILTGALRKATSRPLSVGVQLVLAY